MTCGATVFLLLWLHLDSQSLKILFGNFIYISAAPWCKKTLELLVILHLTKHGGYITEFYWHLLQHFGSVLLSESHSCHPLLSLSTYLTLLLNHTNLKCMYLIGWKFSLWWVFLFSSFIICFEAFYTFTTLTTRIR